MNTRLLAPALVALPVATTSTPAAARRGLARRATASLTGRCDCGAAFVGTTIEHEPDCPAISRAVEQAVAAGLVKWATFKALLPAALLNDIE